MSKSTTHSFMVRLCRRVSVAATFQKVFKDWTVQSAIFSLHKLEERMAITEAADSQKWR